MCIATNKCFALCITNKTENETSSADRYVLGGEYLAWCNEAHDLDVFVDIKMPRQ
jgi:hypothetical protein